MSPLEEPEASDYGSAVSPTGYINGENALEEMNRRKPREWTTVSVCYAPSMFSPTAHHCGKKECPQITQMDTDSNFVPSHLRRSVFICGQNVPRASSNPLTDQRLTGVAPARVVSELLLIMAGSIGRIMGAE
jgi:hypothetical protein